MAGIGFALRALGNERSLTSTLRAYGAAGLISSGPWLISIVSMLLTGVLARDVVPNPRDVPCFQGAVTHVLAVSLLVGGPLQLVFTRFVADRLFEGRRDLVLPNVFGALAVQTCIAVVVALLFVPSFHELSFRAGVALATTFVLVTNVWILVSVLTTIRRHDGVLAAFLLGYGVTLLTTRAAAKHGLEGLLVGFCAGQALLFLGLLGVVVREYGECAHVELSFLDRRKVVPILALTGFLYNLGVWADKLIFWRTPSTSVALLGPLRASEVYDLPIFLAYLSILPGMAVFLLRMETDFSDHYDAFYGAVREGATLERLETLRDAMTAAARSGLAAIFKVQGLTFVLLVSFAPALLDAFGIPRLHLGLFTVDAAGVSMQVLFLAILNVFFFLDRQRTAVFLCATFAFLNVVGTVATLALGPATFGLGFAVATLATSIVGLYLLDEAFSTLVRDTFMAQRLGG